MAFILSTALTAALLSPVFLLAGWIQPPAQAVRVHRQFNRL